MATAGALLRTFLKKPYARNWTAPLTTRQKKQKGLAPRKKPALKRLCKRYGISVGGFRSLFMIRRQ